MNKFTDPPVAIIGMGSLFAQATRLSEYWRLLYRGGDAISDPPPTHLHLNDYFDPQNKKPDHIYCKRGGFLKPIPFDPTEFGIPPTALEATDTSQLLGLVVAKMALNDAGYGDGQRPFDKQKASVILGVTGTQELVVALGSRLGHPKWRSALDSAQVSPDKARKVMAHISDAYVSWQENSFPGLLGNVVAGRICNRLDLGGTNCVVDAACASSLSAVNLALMELYTGRSKMVITGGVDTLNDIFMHMCFSRTGVLSHTGDARPFSRHADGTVLGEGVGLLVLKRLEDAIEDNDRIYAVIKSLGSSSDGKSQSIYAPRAEGQIQAIKRAYQRAGIDPKTVDLIEAHGTGTKVGDQVEFQSISHSFGTRKKEAGRCALGSVKSMIGHTKAAAGAAGLIKAALSLYYKVIPPTLKAEEPDPQLKIEASPFYLSSIARPWPSSNKHPRRAGVNAFGFGGSNFHAVLEEYQPDRLEPAWDGSLEIFAFSGETPKHIAEKIKPVADEPDLIQLPGLLAYKAAQSRRDFQVTDPHRFLMMVSTDTDTTALFHQAYTIFSSDNFTEHKLDTTTMYYGGPESAAQIALVFPGQGSQYIHMARDWFCVFPEALKILEQADQSWSGQGRLSDILFPISSNDSKQKQSQELTLRKTHAAQMALGAVEAAMLAVLRYFKVVSKAYCGHSYGELAALYAAGWYDLATFLSLSDARGRCMAQAGQMNNGGGMLAVKAPLDQIKHLVAELAPEVILANLNSPTQGVLSGTIRGIDDAHDRCRQNKWRSIPLPVAAAFHSPLIEPALPLFAKALDNVTLTPPNTPVYSNVSAEPYPQDSTAAKSWLKKQMVSPVSFIQTIENLQSSGINTFIEVGPKKVLSGLVREILGAKSATVISLDNSLGQKNGLSDLAGMLCQLASQGHPVDLTKWAAAPVKPRRPRMQIMLSGANHVGPKSTANSVVASMASRSVETKAAESFSTPALKRSNQSLERLNPSPKSVGSLPTESPGLVLDRPISGNHNIQPSTQREMPIMSSDSNNQSNAYNIKATLAIVQQGLTSIQALHLATAQTHQKFLEAQTEAGRTLQEMMKQAQHLTGMTAEQMAPNEAFQNSMPAASLPKPLTIPDTSIALHPDNSIKDQIDGLGKAATETIAPPYEPVENPPANQAVQETVKKNEDTEEIQATLLAVVSELTGYPQEMLALDMDIESDLGIDSIKRVEILSTVEERMPDLPTVTPDMLGSLKTLGQIVDFLGAGSSFESKNHHQDRAVRKGGDEIQGDATTDRQNTTASEHIRTTLLNVVSALTGYPKEMLTLDMDIESDLGIDSIKRVEILSAVEERIPDLPAVTPDMLGSLKTLGQITDYLLRADNTKTQPPALKQDSVEPSTPFDSGPTGEIFTAPHAAQLLTRQVVSLQAIDRPVPPVESTPNNNGRIYITQDEVGLSRRLSKTIEDRNFKTTLIDPDKKPSPADFDDAAGLVIMAPISAQAAFALAQTVGPRLIQRAHTQKTFLATISRIDGAFGFYDRKFSDPLQGALAGLVKTAAKEWEGVCCKAVDIDPKWKTSEQIAQTTADFLLGALPDDPIEIGLSKKGGVTLKLQEAPFLEGEISLSTSDVVVITGGGRGVTAEAAIALGQKVPCQMILLGRSPAPEAEPAWLMDIKDPAAMKKAILQHQFSGKTVTPKELEQSFRKYQVTREIGHTLDRIKATGAKAHYFGQDVRDAAALATLFEKIRANMGPIKGLIHGAGVLQDRLIVEKRAEQFHRVYSTKVDALTALLEVSHQDDLKYLILFSSVAARFGNQGQVDYAMANEALNKIARQQKHIRSNCKVVSVNWGPWAGGMVNSTLKREFDRKGIALIPLKDGASAMVAEMSTDTKGPVEVVIGSTLEPAAEKTATSSSEIPVKLPKASKLSQEAPLSLLIKRKIDLQQYPILSDHVLGGKPVVPLALIAEWLGHSALHENPGLLFHGIDALRLLNGIKLDQKKKLIRLMAGKPRRKEAFFEVDVEIRNGQVDGNDVIHSRATALLVDQLPPAPKYKAFPIKQEANSFNQRIPELYDKVLFHGERLKGIQSILSFSAAGMTARLKTAPEPKNWMADPLRSQWIIDPLVLDCAFQMALIWCNEQFGKRCLPSFAASYRQYRQAFPQEGVTAVWEAEKNNFAKIIGNFTFLDQDNHVIARLNGYEAVMDALLEKAFKQQNAA